MEDMSFFFNVAYAVIFCLSAWKASEAEIRGQYETMWKWVAFLIVSLLVLVFFFG